MPAAIGVIAAFGSGAVGAVLAGTATLAEFATVAGAVLTGVGALTGEKDLMKIGAVLSIGGGIAGAIGGGGVAGAEGFEAASSSAAKGVIDEAGATGAPAVTPPATVPDDYGNPMQVGGAPSIMQQSAPGAGPASSQAGQMAVSPNTTPSITPATPAGFEIVNGRLAQAAQSVNPGDLSSWWQRAKQAGSSVLNFAEKNQGLMKVGGDMLAAMYGPAAEKLDWDKSLYQRGLNNLNTPVKLDYLGGGKKP